MYTHSFFLTESIFLVVVVHFSELYGKPSKRVIDTFVEHNLPGIDDWSQGQFQAALNESGAYIHKFQRHGVATNFSEAVQNIVAPNGNSVLSQKAIVPTCATYVGPSFCRTYSHGPWENTSGFVFSPNTRTTINYKGDIYTGRLQGELSPQFHQHVKTQSSWWRRYAESNPFDQACKMYAKKIVKVFDGFGPTLSAFKNRKPKKLRLVVSSQYQQYKIAEMEARANCYFKPNADTMINDIDVDRPSKYIIRELLQKDNVDIKRLSKETLIIKLKYYIAEKPELAVFLRAPIIKISNFSTDECVQIYLNNAANISFQYNLYSSYSRFLSWFKENAIRVQSLDPITALTPNEFQLLPRPGDLIGLIADMRSIASFTECIEGVQKLREHTATISAAEKLKPFIHTIGYFKNTAYTQLGWSQHVIPWSKDGILQFATTGKAEGFKRDSSLSSQFFVPDMFAIFHRIASRGHLNLSFSNDVEIDLLRVASTLPHDFSTIGIFENQNDDKTTLLELAARNNLLRLNTNEANRFKEAFKLFCYIDALRLTHEEKITKAKRIKVDNQVLRETKILIVRIYRSDAEQIKKDLTKLMENNINRLQIKQEASLINGYQRELRAGINDSGKFRYNKDLGCIVLSQGKRIFNQNKYQLGIFTHTDQMRDGGSILSLGIEVAHKPFSLGKTINKIGGFDKNRQIFGIESTSAFFNQISSRDIKFVTTDFEKNLINIKLTQQSHNQLNCSHSRQHRMILVVIPVHAITPNCTFETQENEMISLDFQDFIFDFDQANTNPERNIRLISKSLEQLHHDEGAWISSEAVKVLLHLIFEIYSVVKSS